MKIGIYLGDDNTRKLHGSIPAFGIVGKKFEFHKCTEQAERYKDSYRMGRNATDKTPPTDDFGDGLSFYVHKDDIKFGNILNE